jgi:protein-L-isoaspartate(D-aspartate) O-methyltransferase
MATSRVCVLLIVCVAVVASIAAAQGGRQQFAELRDHMVDEFIVAAGVKNERVIEAMRNTPRHEFVAVRERENAYYDMALPIGEGQTISPPFIVAYMTEQLDPQPDDKVLEIGTGSGFQAAVLSRLVQDVYTIEIKKALGDRAAKTLKKLKYTNIHTKIGDGYLGWPEFAPFDKIIVTCSPESPPEALIEQLKEGGRMLIPVGERYQQTLYLFKKEEGKLVRDALVPTLFVPMTGTAESKRKVLPDALHPAIYNGGFEEITEGGDPVPIGWHWLRQAKSSTDLDAPEGKACITFTNTVPGRAGCALQAFPIDGRQIHSFAISLSVRTKQVRPGKPADFARLPQGTATAPEDEQLPMFGITFYDDRRAIIKPYVRCMGPWRGTYDWEREEATFEVPNKAREAIIRIGLFGATGEASFDDLRLEVK